MRFHFAGGAHAFEPGDAWQLPGLDSDGHPSRALFAGDDDRRASNDGIGISVLSAKASTAERTDFLQGHRTLRRLATGDLAISVEDSDQLALWLLYLPVVQSRP